MRVLLAAVGTRGDVQPALALALELRKLRHANAHQYAAPSIAEHRGIGCVTAVYAPVALPAGDLAWRDTAKTWNERALDRINRNRGRLGIASIDDVLDYALTDHTWLAADATLAPLPATPGRQVFQTGTWVLGDHTPLPADLEAFIRSGEPPIYAGFGSMPAAGDVTSRLIGVARAVGRRIIVSRGWADLDLVDDAPDCIAVDDVSHDVLFPRVAAVVHHAAPAPPRPQPAQAFPRSSHRWAATSSTGPAESWLSESAPPRHTRR